MAGQFRNASGGTAPFAACCSGGSLKIGVGVSLLEGSAIAFVGGCLAEREDRHELRAITRLDVG
jgi:hypothetical protein